MEETKTKSKKFRASKERKMSREELDEARNAFDLRRKLSKCPKEDCGALGVLVVNKQNCYGRHLNVTAARRMRGEGRSSYYSSL